MRKDIVKKPKPPVGKYVSDLEDGQLLALQKRRSLWMLLGHALFVISLLIPQDCYYGILEILWLEGLYFVLMITLIVVMIWASVFNFRRGKIGREISEKVVPKRGLEGFFTFPVFELHFLLTALWFVMQVALIVWRFDVGGLVITLIAACVATAAFMVRLITVRTYRGHTVYCPPETEDAPVVPTLDDETVEDFYEPPQEDGAQIDTEQEKENDEAGQ